MSAQPLRLLLVEDSEDDATLLLRELLRSGYAVTHFDGLSAFSLVRQRGLDVPFLIVSGTIGEDVAVAAMKAGVHDFVLKDRLGRLGPAVARELREAELRAERRKMREQLMLSDRLASLGMLAASVAHELNNPLASLMMNLEYGLNRLEEPGDSREPLQALREAFSCAGLIRDIIRDIKIFSRPEGQHFGPTDVHRVRHGAGAVHLPPPRQRDGRHPRRGQRARPGQRVLDPAARGPGAGGRARFQDEALPPGAGSARARRRGGRGQGLAQAAEHDAILCDLMMPEMSGAQFHHELERLAPEQAERVIFMTGGAFTEETRAFLSTARNPCMDKPIDIQRLFSMLEALPAAGSLQGTHEPSA